MPVVITIKGLVWVRDCITILLIIKAGGNNKVAIDFTVLYSMSTVSD